jgi:glutamate synthase (NADPH/NADH) large chain
MTGGTVVILGEVGDNFGAGFTGGMAFVYDPKNLFELRVNPDTLVWQRIASAHWEQVLRGLLSRHVAETNSRYAAMLQIEWDRVLPHFWQIVPKDYVKYLPVPLIEEAPDAALRA